MDGLTVGDKDILDSPKNKNVAIVAALYAIALLCEFPEA
jgi:hypothetical protein